jgi:hypothetical protein
MRLQPALAKKVARVPAAPTYVGGYGLTGSRGTLGSGVGGRTNGLDSVNPSAQPRMPTID